MIEPGHRGFARFRPSAPPGRAGRRSMTTGMPERARRRDLAVGRLAAAVLGDDDLDAMLRQQRALVVLA